MMKPIKSARCPAARVTPRITLCHDRSASTPLIAELNVGDTT